MTHQDVLNDLTRLINVLLSEELAMDYNVPTVKAEGKRKSIGWSTQGRYSPIASREYGSLDEYKFYLEERIYSVLLYDGSLLQLSYGFNRKALNRHRLCYYPCPYDLDPEIFPGLNEEGPAPPSLTEYIEFLLNEPDFKERLRLRTPLRIDYEPTTAKVGHPACHLHMNQSGCRMAVASPLSVGHFVQFVFYNFYRKIWENHDDLRSWRCLPLPRLDLSTPRGHLYFETVPLSVSDQSSTAQH